MSASVGLTDLRFKLRSRRYSTNCCDLCRGIVVREATSLIGDEAVAHLDYYEFPFAFDPYGVVEDNEDLAEAMDIITGDTAAVWEAIRDHVPVRLAKVVYLARTVVEPPYRRRGIARATLGWVLGRFADRQDVGLFAVPGPLGDDGRLVNLDPRESERRRRDLVRFCEGGGFRRLGANWVWWQRGGERHG